MCYKRAAFNLQEQIEARYPAKFRFILVREEKKTEDFEVYIGKINKAGERGDDLVAATEMLVHSNKEGQGLPAENMTAFNLRLDTALMKDQFSAHAGGTKNTMF